MGRIIVNVEPSSTLESTDMEPPWDSMIRLDNDSPRPVPPDVYKRQGYEDVLEHTVQKRVARKAGEEA